LECLRERKRREKTKDSDGRRWRSSQASATRRVRERGARTLISSSEVSAQKEREKNRERDAAELVAVDGAVVGPGRCGGHVKSAWTGLLPMPGWWARPREQARKRFTPTTTHLLSGAEGTPPAACFRRRRLTNQPTVTAMAMAPRRCKLEMEKRGFPLTVAS
jgi:hypothetical protein